MEKDSSEQNVAKVSDLFDNILIESIEFSSIHCLYFNQPSTTCGKR